MLTKVFFVTVGLLVGSVVIGHPAQAKDYVNARGYRLSTPASWTTQAGPSDSKIETVFYSAVGKNGKLTVPSVEVMTRPMEVMTMAKLVSYAPWMVAGTFAHFHQTSASYTSLNGVMSYDIRGTYPRGSRTICIRELFTIHNGRAYIITTGYPNQLQSSCEAVSDSVVRSIRWR